uniref:EGF-like domain-containing protein n=1 Tax=Monopterus albus TaxID=43700 RepID=A0A3Q3ICU8_MONAL|nr:proepiregulin-like isoform X1 [Monopterus albus]
MSLSPHPDRRIGFLSLEVSPAPLPNGYFEESEAALIHLPVRPPSLGPVRQPPVATEMRNSTASALLSLVGMWASANAMHNKGVQADTGMRARQHRPHHITSWLGKFTAGNLMFLAKNGSFPQISVMLLWPYVLAKSVSSVQLTADRASLSTGQEEERPHVMKRSTQSCNSTFDNYCLNNGQCMLLVDINEHHCKCEGGFYGSRCDKMELVTQPMAEGQIVATVFCVTLLIIGLAGALYLCYKWYKKNRFLRQQKQQGYKGVPAV